MEISQKGFGYKDGKIYNLINSSQIDTSSTKTNELAPIVEYICTSVDWYSCSGGNCSFLYTEDDGCYSEQISSGGGGTDYSVSYQNVASGTNISNPVTIANSIVDTIGINLTTPCFIHVLNSLLNSGLKSNLTSIILGSFGQTEMVNLTFYETATVTGNDPDGSTYPVVKGDFCDIRTTLSETQLANASSEFVAETMIHEILHAYIDATQIETELESHITMITSYMGTEIAFLQQVFPSLTPTNAASLIIGGMQDVQQFDLPTLNAVAAKYGLTIDQAAATNSNYKSGKMGTGCLTAQ